MTPNNTLLLTGEIAGVLTQQFECSLEVDSDHSYTGRILIRRPSGIYAVSVEHIQSMLVDRENASLTDPEHAEFGTGYA